MAPQYAKDQPAGYSNYLKKIAIVGAGGHMGGQITDALLKTGRFTITAITRKDSNHTIPEGVLKAPVDYADKSTIVNALRGQDFLVVTLNVRAPPETGLLLAEAAAEAGIKYIMPNAYGINPFSPGNIFKEMGYDSAFNSVIGKIHEVKLTPVFIACGFWYEFSLGGEAVRYGFDFKKRRVIFFDQGDVKIHTSTWPQSGRAVAAVLSLPILPEDEAAAADKSKPTLLTYSEPTPAIVQSFYVSQKDMFESVKRVTKTTDKDWDIRYEDVQKRYANACEVLAKGPTAPPSTDLQGEPITFLQAYGTRMYSRIFFPGGDGITEDQLANKALGLPEEDLDEWTQRAVDFALNGELAKYGQ